VGERECEKNGAFIRTDKCTLAFDGGDEGKWQISVPTATQRVSLSLSPEMCTKRTAMPRRHIAEVSKCSEKAVGA